MRERLANVSGQQTNEPDSMFILKRPVYIIYTSTVHQQVSSVVGDHMRVLASDGSALIDVQCHPVLPQ